MAYFKKQKKRSLFFLPLAFGLIICYNIVCDLISIGVFYGNDLYYTRNRSFFRHSGGS